MHLSLIETITSSDPAVRERSLEELCDGASLADLVQASRELDQFRRRAGNLYERVRALFFLTAIHRYLIPQRLAQAGGEGGGGGGLLSHAGHQHLLQRRFDEAIDQFRHDFEHPAPNDAASSGLAAAYHELAFTTLAAQVRRCVRSVRGNQWMFRTGHALDHPLQLRRELLERDPGTGLYPVLCETTPVRMDLTHSAWSDIFFLGMDYPEGARVLNVSIDLGVHGRDAQPRPPIEVYFRVIDEPVLRLVSVDMQAQGEVSTVADMFDFASDYLGLVKAGLIAAGLVPPGLEGAQLPLADVLGVVVGPGLGLEVVTRVNDIPKGSRLAVSTNLLAGIIAACMRATAQVGSLTGPLTEDERRLVAARAVLGEWQGGSGGGWQDSGGVWPGIKLIAGELAQPGDAEHGVSRGRLLPRHRVYNEHEISPAARRALSESLVLVHGGMAQDVGPILRMVTEKYLLRGTRESRARATAIGLLAEIEAALAAGDIRGLASATTRNFQGPIQDIIPWACNHYTQTLIDRAQARFGDAFWGFLMLGGMSGGGMGFFFDPQVRPQAVPFLQQLMREVKRELQEGFPFAMEPVVYDFAVNNVGTSAVLQRGSDALLPAGYYTLVLPDLVRRGSRDLPRQRRSELELLAHEVGAQGRLANAGEQLLSCLLPRPARPQDAQSNLPTLLRDNGFDPELHEQIRADLRAGRIGLAQNRLPVNTELLDVEPGDVLHAGHAVTPQHIERGRQALANGEVAVFTLAAGAGTRWTRGAGVVKALHRFHRFAGRYRSFLEVHLAKTRRRSREFSTSIPHLFATSYLTDDPIRHALPHAAHGLGPVLTSRGQSVGLRMIPMVRDLRFAWEETSHQRLDDQAEKMRASLHAALIHWAESAGCGNDYTDNLPGQCLHPVGHWFEIPSLLRNGVLHRLLAERPRLRHLLLHNIDTLGADLDPGLLGLHIASGAGLTFEVIHRRIEDRGGGLARVGGRVRLVEGLTMPREEDEFKLTYYNTLTTWIDLDRLLEAFALTREQLGQPAVVTAAIRRFSQRLPTYITIKDVKRRWGHGQEDILPVSQFEKLWGDMSAVPEIDSRFVVVPRPRGQQLKEQAQLDGWLRDGSAAAIEALGDWD
jgi:hypothetical protein